MITVIAMMFSVLSSLTHRCPRGRGGAAACHKCHSDSRRGFGEHSWWTRIGRQQQQIINVPAVQLEWIFSAFSMLVLYPIPVILKKTANTGDFLLLFSFPKRGRFNVFPLHIDRGICRVSVNPCQISGLAHKMNRREHMKGTQCG